MSVIELAKPGQESTTYELLITASNAANTVGSVVATQLLWPLNSVACYNSVEQCTENEVFIGGGQAGFNATDGPKRYTIYTIVTGAISIFATLVLTRFLPRDKNQCHLWREEGVQSGASIKIGIASLLISLGTVGYGFIVGILLLNSSTSCFQAIGGTGC